MPRRFRCGITYVFSVSFHKNETPQSLTGQEWSGVMCGPLPVRRTFLVTPRVVVVSMNTFLDITLRVPTRCVSRLARSVVKQVCVYNWLLSCSESVNWKATDLLSLQSGTPGLSQWGQENWKAQAVDYPVRPDAASTTSQRGHLGAVPGTSDTLGISVAARRRRWRPVYERIWP